MRSLLMLSVAAVVPTSNLYAQTAPAPASPAPATPADAQEIVVVAPAEQRTAIDRETYLVRDTAQARTSNALDILGRIPSVTVQPDNSIRLLGTAGVTVLVDGRPSPNPNILRDLQGSEIVRIGVVSNPSAQFSASGTGGIINIITRRNALNGLRGSVTASLGRYDSYELRASPSWTSGDWTVSGNLGWTRNGNVLRSTRERVSLDPASSVPDNSETQNGRGRFEFVNASGQISYRLTDKRTLTFQGGLISAESEALINSQLVIGGNAGAPLTQFITNDFSYSAYSASLEYRAESSRPGELLTASVQQYRFDPTNDILTDFGAGEFRFRSDSFTRASIAKLDYVRPLGGGRRILVGGSISDTRDFSSIEQSGDLPLGANPFPTLSIIDGTVPEAASYASFQFPLLGGTLLAGLRVEGRNYDFADPSLGEGPNDEFFFPSVHLERRLAPWLNGNLSFSRRITWPVIQQLSPALRFQDSTTAFGGNPALRPEITDSYEARVRAEVARQTISLTMFNRRTNNLFSRLSTLGANGVLVTVPVNLGERSDLGASLAVQGTIVQGLSYNLNANLIDRRIDREGFGLLGEQRSTNYSGMAQLDYRDGADGRRGADRITATVNFSGPYDDGLVRTSSFLRASVSWSHAISDRLSAVVTLDDLFGPTEFRSRTISDSALTRTSNFTDGPRYKFALTYTLGRPGQPQPQAPAGPAIPIPGAQ